MNAIWYERRGPARDVLVVGHMDTPSPGPGEVLVRVHASGVNPSDTKTRSGWAGVMTMPYPRIVPHQDGAGVIEAVGQGVSASRVGERVWIYEAQWQRPLGTGAQYVSLPSERAVPLPGTTGFVEGACIGIPIMTAHRAVFADGPVTGQTVLVTGGAGSVGHYAVQLAKWGGATVIATVSSDAKARAARQAGADHVINYRTGDTAQQVLDATGGVGVGRIVEVALAANLAVSEKVLKADGVIAAYASDTDPQPRFPFRPLMVKNAVLRVVLVYTMSRTAKDAAIRDITRLLDQTRLQHNVFRVFAFDDVAAAHEAVETGKALGNVVVEVC